MDTDTTLHTALPQSTRNVPPSQRSRAASHREYLDTLIRPSPEKVRTISERQIQKEAEISAKYHSSHPAEEHEAAEVIQRAYRGHRERRQLNGLNLNPSDRWKELIKEWRYRSAIAPHCSGAISPERPQLERNPSDTAKTHWRRATQIAEHAAAREVSPENASLRNSFSSKKPENLKGDEIYDGMLLDLRYFLEMVDTKHRYGANLQIYHEEWQRSNTSQNFLYWLDHGEGRNLDLAICPRGKLEKEQIRYLSKEERLDYLVHVDEKGLLRWAKNDELITTSNELYRDSMHGIVPKGSSEPTFDDEDTKRKLSADASFSSRLASIGGAFHDTLKSPEPEDDISDSSTTSSESFYNEATGPRVTDEAVAPSTKPKKVKRKLHVSPATILNQLLRATVRPGTWIYVADTVGRLYVGIKSSGAFQHASFLSGSRISSAGAVSIEDGRLTYLSPRSGHYRPTTKSFKRFISHLKNTQHVDLSQLKISSSYQVLLGIEYYGATQKVRRKIFHPQKEHQKSKAKHEVVVKNELLRPLTLPDANATKQVDSNWRRKQQLESDKKGLAKVMGDLHIRKRSK